MNPTPRDILIQRVAARGIAPGWMKWLLTFMEAPPSLKGFWWVVSRMLKVLDGWRVGEEDKSGFDPERARQTLKVVQQILMDETSFPQARNPKPHGLKRERPLYALLMHRPHLSRHDRLFTLVCAYGSVGYHVRKRAGIKRTTLYRDCEAAWALFDKHGPSHILDAIQRDLGSSVSKEVLSLLFNTYMPDSSWPAGQSHARHIQAVIHLISMRGHARTVPDEVLAPECVVRRRHLGQRGAIYSLTIGASRPATFRDAPWSKEPIEHFPFEEDEEDSPASVILLPPKQFGFSPRFSVRLEKSSHYHQATILRAKVTHQWSHLTPEEIERVKALCTEHDDALAKVALAMALYCGWTPREMSRIRFEKDAAPHPKAMYALVDRFLIPELLPLRIHGKPPVKHFVLPMPDLVRRLLSLWKQWDAPQKMPHARSIETRLKRALKNMIRPTPIARVANTFIHVGEKLGVDPVILANLTQRPMSDNQTQIHYTSLPHGALVTACRGIQEAIGIPQPFDQFPDVRIREDRYGDSKAIPMDQAKALFGQAVHALGHLPVPGSPYSRHASVRSIFLFLTLQFTTGVRAATNPDIYLDDLDDDSGLLPVNDKRVHMEHSLRFIYVPRHVRQLIRRYLSHRSQWLALETILRDKEPENLPRFILRTDNGAVPIDRASIRHLVNTRRDISDIGRHFFRTALVERGCPTEIINAQMGHWHTGSEPYGPASTLSPLDFARVIAPHLEAISHDLAIENAVKIF